ncbi:alpha/beta hydrolase [Pannus brasiliensis CCIBt3594]|uniref:Alpha/beta hydrolase n=1 Tax=Pannus brasiliensis CCIBt3594 TaxID=1427578 RepID=A0AAW9QTF3_9CHRO
MPSPIDLHVEIKGQGYPILCLHGHPGSGRSMSVFTDRLSQRFRTLAPDLRGYGKSRFRGNFQLQEHLDDVILLLDRHEIRDCLVLGWSLGGIIALELILRQPDRFTGLISIASAARPFGDHPPITSLDLAFTGIAGAINSFKPGWRWNIDTFARRSLFRYLFGTHSTTAYHYLARDGVHAYLKTSRSADRALQNALRLGYDRRKDLDKISIPCLFMAGALDRHITSASSHETAKHLPECEWRCYENTAHLFPWEIPDRVTGDIDSWLDRVFLPRLSR